ncbi:hypothetical protein QX776_00395 [Alteromonadaceae bacterium BrNp21-10]|nr:hypothetical protein [Alteromonadaceae bacterium BrNp21-10]
MLTSKINTPMIVKLIAKDWHLYKKFMLGYCALGVIAAGIMTLPTDFSFHLGVVVLITVLIGASAHVLFASIVIEKKESQLSFIMGLPINVTDYALSKLLGGIAIYLTCWLPIVLVTLLIFTFSPIPNGLIPMLILCALEILVGTVLLLSVGITSGSEAVTIVTMVIINLLFNVFLFAVVRLEGIHLHMAAETAVFNQTVMSLIGAGVLIILLIIAVTTYIKSRKVCFL